MATVEQILLKFKGVDDGVTATQRKVKDGMDDIDKSTKNADSSTKSLHGNMNKLSGAMTGLGGAIASAGILMFYQQAMQMSAGSEQTWGRFSVALGKTGLDIKQVKTEYGGLVDTIANDTGRLKGDITTILADLSRVGIVNKDVLKSSSESITALAYLTQEDVGTIEQGFTKLIGKSQIQERALMSIGIRGNVFTEVLKKNGYAMEDWANMSEETRASMLNQAVAMQNGAEANEAYKDSYEGMMNQITQTYKTFMTEVGNVLLPVFKAIAEKGIPVLQQLLGWFKGLPMDVKAVIVLLPLVLAGLVAIGGALMFLNPVASVVGSIGDKLGILPDKSKKAKDAMGDIPCPDPCSDDGTGGAGGKGKGKGKSGGSTPTGFWSKIGLSGAMAGTGEAVGIAGAGSATILGLLGAVASYGLGRGTQALGNYGKAQPGTTSGQKLGYDIAPLLLGMSNPIFGGLAIKGAEHQGDNAILKWYNANKSKWIPQAQNKIQQDVAGIFAGAGNLVNPDAWSTGLHQMYGLFKMLYCIIRGCSPGLIPALWDLSGVLGSVGGSFSWFVGTVDGSMRNFYNTIANWTQLGIDKLKELYCMVVGCSPGIIPAFKKMAREVPMHIGNTLPAIQQLGSSIGGVPDVNYNGGLSPGGSKIYYYNDLKFSGLTREELISILMEIFNLAGARNIPQGDATQ